MKVQLMDQAKDIQALEQNVAQLRLEREDDVSNFFGRNAIELIEYI